MKTTTLKSRLASLSVVFAIGAGSLAPLSAQDAAAPKEGVSKHYEAVAKHLELGGAFYGYMDMDSDASELGKMIDMGLDSVRGSGAEIPETISGWSR
jgi:hypothetical protein